MQLYNTTLLGAYLAHLQSLVRKLPALDFEKSNHPEADVQHGRPARADLRDTWNLLDTQLQTVLGSDAALVPFNQLAASGVFHAQPVTGRNPFRTTFAALKKMADKHRCKDPSFTLLASWDVEARHRPEPEE